ncbi:uncharacterized protein LOC115282562 [Suricata suricatta]|uniref:uncharacterized protein LOC115282562 n=1 Tax=Suricata suricatta TaxID=37032 RepID=UPI001155B61D|nr:uncharacterized protein LOC115282562 [Suricata suricatta]
MLVVKESSQSEATRSAVPPAAVVGLSLPACFRKVPFLGLLLSVVRHRRFPLPSVLQGCDSHMTARALQAVWFSSSPSRRHSDSRLPSLPWGAPWSRSKGQFPFCVWLNRHPESMFKFTFSQRGKATVPTALPNVGGVVDTFSPADTVRWGLVFLRVSKVYFYFLRVCVRGAGRTSALRAPWGACTCVCAHVRAPPPSWEAAFIQACSTFPSTARGSGVTPWPGGAPPCERAAGLRGACAHRAGNRVLPSRRRAQPPASRHRAPTPVRTPRLPRGGCGLGNLPSTLLPPAPRTTPPGAPAPRLARGPRGSLSCSDACSVLSRSGRRSVSVFNVLPFYEESNPFRVLAMCVFFWVFAFVVNL